MPLISVQAGSTAMSAPAGLGTQVVAGKLVLADPTYIEFDAEIFGRTSTLYRTFTVFTFDTVEPAYDLLATVPTDPATCLRVEDWVMALLGYTTYKFQTVGKSITVTFS